MNYPDFVASRKKSGEAILESLNDRKASALHMLLGFVGEWLEYRTAHSRENAKEELGDMCFYLTGLTQDLGFTPKTPRAYKTVVCDTTMTVHMEALVDAVIRIIFRNKPQDDKQLVTLIDNLFTVMAMQAESLDTTLGGVDV